MGEGVGAPHSQMVQIQVFLMANPLHFSSAPAVHETQEEWGRELGVSVRGGRNGRLYTSESSVWVTADGSLDIGARLTWDHVPAVPLTERVSWGHIYTTSQSLSFLICEMGVAIDPKGGGD